jgi:cell division protein ZapA
MERRTVQLQIAGQSYRVVSSAPEAELRHLAEIVTSKMTDMSPPGRVAPPQAMLLAAMALAHDLEQERSRREALERKTRDLLRRVLMRIDDALEPCEESESAGLE